MRRNTLPAMNTATRTPAPVQNPLAKSDSATWGLLDQRGDRFELEQARVGRARPGRVRLPGDGVLLILPGQRERGRVLFLYGCLDRGGGDRRVDVGDPDEGAAGAVALPDPQRQRGLGG